MKLRKIRTFILASLAFFVMLGIISFITVSGAKSDTLDWNNPWSPGTPFPKFIETDYLDLNQIEAISKFRSGAGHAYSDQYEAPDRSMKHYYVPLSQYREANGTNYDLNIFSPLSGTIVGIEPETHIISSGEFRGYLVIITPDGYPMFNVRLFHVNYLSTLTVGTHVTSGQWLGFADLREAYDSDISVECVYGESPVYDWGGPNDRGLKMISVFQVMTDSMLDKYSLYGITDISEVIISKEYRDLFPVTDWSVYHPDDWVPLSSPVPLPGTIMMFGAGLLGLIGVGFKVKP